MKTSDKIDALAPDYIAAQAELKNATFDKVNPHFKSRYATLAQVRDTVTPVLAKHGLAIIQGTSVEREAALVITRLIHKSGQWIEISYPFAIGKPQEMGSSYSYARRYSLSAITNTASEEDDDGNTATGQAPAKPKLVTATGEKATPHAQSRAPYAEIQDGIREIIKTGGTIEDLQYWYKSHEATIKAFSVAWHDEIMAEFTDAKSEIKKRDAA